VASIGPLGYLAQRVGGEHVTVGVLLPPGQSPHSYDPPARQIAELGKAELFLVAGLTFDLRLAERLAATRPDLPVVDTRQGIELAPMDGSHQHEGEPCHPGESLDPHIWLSARLAGRIATTIAEAFKRADADHAEYYDSCLATLQRDLDSVDAELRDLLAPVAGGSVYVFHPAYGYYLRDYGLQQVAIEVDGKEPTIKDLVAVMERARRDKVTSLFVQPQFSADEVTTIAAQVGASVAVLDPLAADYLDNLTAMGRAIRAALEQAHE
jgi:zinc transport system substrate-binding protein